MSVAIFLRNISNAMVQMDVVGGDVHGLFISAQRPCRVDKSSPCSPTGRHMGRSAGYVT
jgi:hypothetical protein